MNLSDHLRPLLREHDCVIIPDFGGLVAEYAPARVQLAGRHLLSPPTRHVAFNQALTRNDGLLLDALRQHLGLSAAEAREQLRQAVAALHQELQTQQRIELPGVGVFRQLAGRGLQFEYTGTENLFAAAYGLPELTAHPIAVIDARLAREQQAQLVPRLRAVATRSNRVPLRRLVRGGAIGLAAGVVAAAVYLLSLHPTVVPMAWQSYVPRWEQLSPAAAPQQAALAHAPLATPSTPPAPAVEAVVEEKIEMPTVVLKTTPVPAATMPAAVKPAPAAVATAPTVVAAAKPVAKPVVSIHNSKAVAVATVAAKTAATVASPAKAATAAAVPTASATTIRARTGRFYVMVAAYSSLARAEEGRRNLAHAGRPAKVIAPYPGTRYYRLTAADYADRPTALAAAARLRQNPHLDKGLSVIAY
jgi:hypothetical protein